MVIRSSDNPFRAMAKFAAKLDPKLNGEEETFSNIINEVMNE